MQNGTQSAPNSRVNWTYLSAHSILGGAVLLWAVLNWECVDALRFGSFLTAALIGSALKVRLPGVKGTASVGALFVLTSVVDLSRSEAIMIAAAAILTQCLWRPMQRPRPVQVLFALSNAWVAVYLTSLVYDTLSLYVSETMALACVVLSYFFANTFPLACIVALTEAKNLRSAWRGSQWVLAYYSIGACLAWMVSKVPENAQWQIPIVGVPVIYLVYRSNRTHVAKMETEKGHMEHMNALHLRTIEALALAIDAKDHTTHDHLQRVQHYAIEVGKSLGLSPAELEALRAASVLHDIGKLAVPEHIISKPGKLTPAEFEKMKVHPVVGAEILERVAFPYPVTPIVRSHHEKWDGSGYPDGLAGEQIPIGARILAAVDCLDALASDRQYRRALPLDEAMARIASEAGTSFDPAVVRVLQERYVELESEARAIQPALEPVLSKDLKITRGAAPAAGFESVGSENIQTALSVLDLQKIDRAADPAEAFHIFGEVVQAAVPYDALAFYAFQDEMLELKFVCGDRALLPGVHRIAAGEGLIGWVASAAQPILNGNPDVDAPAYEGNGPLRRPQSALALPVSAGPTLIGVLAFYRIAKDAFAAVELEALRPLLPSLAPHLVPAGAFTETAA